MYGPVTLIYRCTNEKCPVFGELFSYHPPMVNHLVLVANPLCGTCLHEPRLERTEREH
jgi:hypothetical protein